MDNETLIKTAYEEIYKNMGIIKIREVQLASALNTKFETDIIRKIYYNGIMCNSYSLAIEYINDNGYYHTSVFKGEEISKLKNLKQFKKYLEKNRIN